MVPHWALSMCGEKFGNLPVQSFFYFDSRFFSTWAQGLMSYLLVKVPCYIIVLVRFSTNSSRLITSRIADPNLYPVGSGSHLKKNTWSVSFLNIEYRMRIRVSDGQIRIRVSWRSNPDPGLHIGVQEEKGAIPLPPPLTELGGNGM